MTVRHLRFAVRELVYLQLLSTIVAGVLLLVPTPLMVSVRAQSPSPPVNQSGAIGGQVTNGTDGKHDVPGVQVRVLPLGDQQSSGVITATVDATGQFSVTELTVGPGAEYGLMATYEGVDYIHPELARLTPGQPTLFGVNLTVYEPDEAVDLVIRTAHVVVSPAPEQGAAFLTEVWVIRNDTDRTRVAGQDGAVLWFDLPPGARSIDVRDPRVRASAKFEDNILFDREPVPPGEREVVLTYEVPYGGMEFTFSRTLPLPVAELQLMVIAPGAVVDSPMLPEQGTTELNGRPVVRAGGSDLAAGSVIEALIRGLPKASGGGASSLRSQQLPVVDQRPLAVVVLVIALVGMLLAVRYPDLSKTPGVSRRRTDRLSVERADVLDELARLERRCSGGTVSGEEYARLRPALMERALALTLQLRAARKGSRR